MAIYNGTQKVSMSGIDKVYVGTTLVYQKAPTTVTITYASAIYQALVPVSKTVPAGYQLTSADLPTLTGSTVWSTDRWTASNDPTDAGTAVTVGTVVNQDITLYAVWKGTSTITRTNIYKRDTRSGANLAKVTQSIIKTSTGGTVSVSVEGLKGDGSWYNIAMLFGGVLQNVYLDKPASVSWTPTQTSIVWKTGSSTSTASNLYPKLAAQQNTAGTLVPVTETTSGTTRKLVIDDPSYFVSDTVRVRVGYGYDSNTYLAKYRNWTISSSNISNYILQTPSGNWSETVWVRSLA